MATTRVLVVDHRDSYTYNLVHLLAAVTGLLPDVVQHDDPLAASRWRDGYTHLVLSPGPGSVHQAADFAVGRAIITDSTVPVLGVCLGMQGMVAVLGGRVAVVAPAHGEVARVRHDGTGVLAGVPQGFAAVRYHSQAVFDTPVELVANAWCRGVDGEVVMGVAHRDRPLHGVQFHPESVLSEHGLLMAQNFLALQ